MGRLGFAVSLTYSRQPGERPVWDLGIYTEHGYAYTTGTLVRALAGGVRNYRRLRAAEGVR